MDEELKVPIIAVVPDETVDSDQGYCYGVHVMKYFNNGGGVNRKEYQEYLGPDLDEEYMEGVRLNYKIEHHFWVVLGGNYVGVEYQKAILHTNRWDVYMNNKRRLLRVGILLKFQVMMGRSFFGKW